MNAIRNKMENIDKSTTSKTNLTLVSKKDKKEAENVAKDYLNEKLSYFYSHGGPIMDL